MNADKYMQFCNCHQDMMKNISSPQNVPLYPFVLPSFLPSSPSPDNFWSLCHGSLAFSRFIYERNHNSI